MIISNPQEMIEFGKQISQKHNKVLLYGDLGAGKTHFTKGFVEGLGLNPDQVQSPTYTYINEYESKILHIDMYRLSEFNDMVEKGILDSIETYDYIIIEWPKFEDEYIENDWIKIKIDKIDENSREISY